MNKYFFNHDLSPLLGLADSQIITFIGGGGKTSLMNTLGKEFASHGYPTLLTTTTHIMKPDFLSDESYIENEDLGQLANIFTNLKKNTLPLAALGIPEKVVNSNIKWRSPSSDFCEKIAEFSKKFSTKNPYKFFKILCEGDGSKRLPIKLPKDGEPVFVPKTATVNGDIGESYVGKPIKETLFRYELLPNLTSLDNYFIKSLQSADIVTTDFLYRLCLSEKGLRKNITSQKFCIIFNQADILDEKALAEVITLRNQLQTKGICPHIISVKNNYIIN